MNLKGKKTPHQSRDGRVYFDDGRLWDRNDAERYFLSGSETITVYLNGGDKFKCKLIEMGTYVIVVKLLTTKGEHTAIIYKHGISMIVPGSPPETNGYEMVRSKSKGETTHEPELP